MELYTHEYFMNEAFKEAQKAYDSDEVPVGAVIVANHKIIARAHNFTERLNDVTAHAEMQAITAAANSIGGKYLQDCTLYVTLEPCVMCAGALHWTHISKIVYGARDEKKGFTKIHQQILHPKTSVISGVLETQCSTLLKDFFQTKRK
ncbi:MAG: deaminase [Bacteroidota bacterium]|jgi:tRNA(adenine34) deaminase|nr:deaminase [Bacteroidota bacterium]